MKTKTKESGSGKYTVYYETGSSARGTKVFHKSHHKTVTAATNTAKRISKQRGRGYITVLGPTGREIKECYKGSCKRGRGY